MTRRIEVVPHDPRWAQQFQAEAVQLVEVLGTEVAAIHHIGSTAIPGIRAKPIIDVLVEVRDIEAVDAFNETLQERGYIPKGEHGIPGRRFFIKGTEEIRSHHIHIFERGDPEVNRHLDFRDYLRAHPEEARAYSDLKKELALRHPEDIESYVAGKDDLIKALDRRAQAWRQKTKQAPENGLAPKG